MKPWEMMRRFGVVGSPTGGGDVVLILNGGPPTGTTTFVDQSPYAASLTRYGSVAYSDAQSKFGDTSIYCPATPNGGLLTPTNARYKVGTGDFCFETWLYPLAVSGQRGIFDTRVVGGSSDGFFLYIQDGRIAYYDGSSSYYPGLPHMAVDAWQYVKMYRALGVVTVEVDDVVKISQADTSNYVSEQAFVGAGYYYPVGVVPLAGYLGPLMYTVGGSRSGEGVPTGPFPT